MAIELPDEIRERLISAIRAFFEEELEQEIGDLKAQLVLDFMTREIGPTLYNRAIADAQTFLHEKLLDMEGQLFELESRDFEKNTSE